jgi:hypothetical protein
MTEYIIFLVKVPPEHLRRLVDSMFNLNGNTSPSLRFFDNLEVFRGLDKLSFVM